MPDAHVALMGSRPQPAEHAVPVPLAGEPPRPDADGLECQPSRVAAAGFEAVCRRHHALEINGVSVVKPPPAEVSRDTDGHTDDAEVAA
jgi:hypothetical protein